MSLYTKIAEVIAEVEEVAKTGHNDHFNYSYATAEEILKIIRTPLAGKGVVLLPSLQSVEERPYQTVNRNGEVRESVITTAHIRYTFVDSETGETHDCDWAGQGDDPSDKGWGKSATNAAKTFLRTAFLLPQGDDPEADGEADARAQDRKSSGVKVTGRSRNGKPSDAALKFLRDILSGNAKGPLREKKPSLEQLKIMLSRLGSPVDPSKQGWTEELSRDHCSELLTWFNERPLPSVEYPSDVPNDGFEPPSQQELEAARLEFEEAK